MRFSDIHMIMIGEEGEYGRRLVRYLETHLSTAIRVYHFTTTESFLAFKERADIYLLDEAFFQRLSEEKQNVLLREKRLILLTAQEEEGTFCKYHNPKELLDRLRRFSDEMEDLASREDRREEESVEGREDGRETARTRLTMIYSPVYEEKLKEIARSFMKEGDVYIGAEDLGYKENISAYGQGSDMGDLCYYIHLREEHVMDRMRDMLVREEDIEVLHPPDMYFYLRELTKEDYTWFFDKVRKEGTYREVFWGAGMGFVSDLDILRCFDRIILLDSRENIRLNLFCDRLEKVLNLRSFHQGAAEQKEQCQGSFHQNTLWQESVNPRREASGQESWKRVYREDILNGTAW